MGTDAMAGGQDGANQPPGQDATSGPVSPPPVEGGAPDVTQPATGDTLPPCVRTVPVANSAALATAISAAQPGDCITLADGDYAFPIIAAKGTAAAPIVISAVNLLKAGVSTGDLKMQGAAYVVVQGINWTSNGTLWMTDTDHGRITRSRIQRTETGPQQSFHDISFITVFNTSKYCRIDHSDLGPQSKPGNMILITGTETNPILATYTRIDHNYFHDVYYAGGNGWETIRSGADTLQFSSSFTVIEHNLFKNDANDPEIISTKSCDNTIRYNTLRASAGQFNLRSGNRGLVYGNYILADGAAGTLGLRVGGGQHKIFNNYIEGVNPPGIFLEGGDSVDTAGIPQDRKQVYKTEVVFNTIVNSGGIALGGGGHPLDPIDCTVAYNLVQGTGALYSTTPGSHNITYVGNIGFMGTSQVSTGVMLVDPKLMKVGSVFTIGPGSPAINAGMPTFPYVTEDVEGKSRDSMPDIGANEVSPDMAKYGPLTQVDVGPMAP
jgi:hypothetical protein